MTMGDGASASREGVGVGVSSSVGSTSTRSGSVAISDGIEVGTRSIGVNFVSSFSVRHKVSAGYY